jgi:hypothetical protein
MINRGAILLRYKEPAVRWIHEADPCPDEVPMTLEEVNRERIVYLVSEDDADGDDAVESWVRLNFELLFENELEGWYTDPDLWPQDRSYELFREWFSVECHSMLVDTVDDVLIDDEI